MFPRGAIIHYTASRASSEDDALRVFSDLSKRGIKAVTIGPTGRCYFPSDWDTRWGPHAGQSYHPVLGEYVSKFTIGFEVVCEGKLEFKDGKYYSWFGSVVPKERVNSYSKRVGNIHVGHYAAFTPAQIERLIELLLGLKQKHKQFDLNLVLGHDEVALPPGRKIDPGGSLGMTMQEFRDLLKTRYSTIA